MSERDDIVTRLRTDDASDDLLISAASLLETDDDEIESLRAEVARLEQAIKVQASAAITGMNAATAISSNQLEQARRLHAASNPDALESERAMNASLTADVERLEGEVERLTAERDSPRNRCPQCDQLRLELGEAESLRAENERLKIEAARHETEMGEVIDERDEMESALSAAHVALGGDGEWACRVPSPPPPDSGNLSLDVPVLAAQVLARAEAAEKAIERVLPAKAREHIDCWKVNYGLDRYDKVTAARRWAEAGGPSDGPIMALATAIEWLEST